MSIVITTPTGNIGSAVTRALLDAGEKPVLIARDPAKVKDATDRGAIAIAGSHADATRLTEATRGAQALFLLAPPDAQTQDICAHNRRYAEAAVQAIRANSIPHVVHLSSVGADLESGNGPVAGLFVAERILDDAGIENLTHLRPAYFMENTLMQIPNILQAGRLFTSFPADTMFPMIATRDIAARAADLLLRRETTGARIIELHGAGETSYEEVAETLSARLGRELEHVPVTTDQLVQALTGAGLSQVMAESLGDLTTGIVQGRIKTHEPRGETNTTPTTYAEFAAEVFEPVFRAAEGG